MKVYVKAPAKLSRAMFRVANALERYAPDDVQVVDDLESADLLVHHVIGLEAINYRLDKPCVVLQYCTGGGEDRSAWQPLWSRARVVWSYYDLTRHMPPDAVFYHAALGIDPVFRPAFVPVPRDFMVMTSGYVNGHGQEAIEEPTLAAQLVGGTPVHLGPPPEGFSQPMNLNLFTAIGDADLATVYRRTKWVAGLRFVEGFELGVVEGLACGARPIVFDRADNRHWFGEHATYVSEESGDSLMNKLAKIFGQEPVPVSADERVTVLAKFNWKTLVSEFWDLVKEKA